MADSELKIYHNPRCRKSREGLQFLEVSGKPFEIIKYLDEPLTASELKKIIALLKIAPIDLIRKNEKIWKEEFKAKVLNEDELISVMVENPKLIERPIVVFGDKAVIARPAERINELL